ncbi:hypothetical protein M3Y98_00379900 [Aphelenchoides besseyi]|nr:hypothetical protein M3Y98_00379900 [Aphelenchoides besseyi]KAI6201901.1 hypothetical protein M3Y96_00891500 [Aphelenchoides besseyi]
MHFVTSQTVTFHALMFAFLFFDVNARCPDAANEKIQYCVHPVAEYAKVLNQHDNNTNNNGRSQFGNALQLPKLGGQVFRELCRERCPKHITINLIEASYGYLCNEGYETFMASAECLMELDQQPSVKHCHDETLKDIEDANIESALRMESKLTRMCGALNYFSACVRQHIWQQCGVDSWHVIFRVLKDTTKTLMPTCVFNGQSSKLDAEQRIDEYNRFDRTRRPHTQLPPFSQRTTKTNDDFAVLPTSSMYSSTEIEARQSLEAEVDGGELLQPPQPQNRNDQPISFEIHEESERPPDQAANYERFSLWSSSSRSHLSPLLTLILLFCLMHRIDSLL